VRGDTGEVQVGHGAARYRRFAIALRAPQ
jgi:hypothetical protein